MTDRKQTGVESIAKERQRQIEKEGWSPEHDDMHTKSELSKAAACYAWAASLREKSRGFMDEIPDEWWNFVVMRKLWRWDRKWWKPKNRRSDLVQAGALIAAEIDRLDRIEAKEDHTND